MLLVQFCLSLLLAIRPPAAQSHSPPRLLFDGVHVVDVVAGSVLRDRQIVIAGDRIVAIRAAGTKADDGDSLVTAFRGDYVIPGLIDTHVHLGSTPREPSMVRALLEAAVMGGVTTVRDMGGRGDIVRPLMRSNGATMPRVLGAAVMAGPRSMWFSGARAGYLSGGADSASWVRRVERVSDAAPAIAAAKRAGATGIKLYSDLTRELVIALARAARDSGLEVWSHAAIGPASPVDAIDAGVSIVSHVDQLVWALGHFTIPVNGPGGALRDSLLFNIPPTDPRMQALFATMRAKGIALEPTLTVMSGGLLDTNSAGAAAAQRFVGAAAALAAGAQRAGVNVIAGTDHIGGASPNIHAELALLVHMAGFTPVEALRAATVNAARALHRSDLGLIAVGRTADLVMLRENPLENIAATQSVAGVVLAGRPLVRTVPMRTPPIAALFGRGR